MPSPRRDYPGLSIHPKVAAAGFAGAATTLLVWGLSLVGVELPAEVASALTVLISGGAGYKKSS
jgi:hypothetical protein